MNPRTTLLAAAIFGVTGVALGAFGAHALKETLLERGMTVPWETAARYQLVHSAALLALAAWQRTARGAALRRAGWAAASWAVGLVLFSGSLYALALGGPRWLGPVTPLGGISLLSGWICLMFAAWAKDE